MKKLLLSLLCIAVLCCTATAFAVDMPRGVVAEERIINLPNDQAKWYISVVGDKNDANYQRVLRWFTTNEKLNKVRDQVHFCPIITGTAVYNTRYASNVKKLPTVRMQKPDGTVVFEVSGTSIPMSAEGLNGAMAESIRPLLPWRRNHTHPQPAPEPCPVPDTDPEPQPIDDSNVPFFNEPASRGVPTFVCILAIVGSVLTGAVGGLVIQWKKTYAE